MKIFGFLIFIVLAAAIKESAAQLNLDDYEAKIAMFGFNDS